jgi:hypothetical protein
MKIRLMGLPAEIDQAINALRDLSDLDVVQVDGPYPNRGDSRMVRVYIEARLCGRDGDAP